MVSRDKTKNLLEVQKIFGKLDTGNLQFDCNINQIEDEGSIKISFVIWIFSNKQNLKFVNLITSLFCSDLSM